MFWSGADFGEEALDIVGAKFRDASVFLNAPGEVDREDLTRWIGKARQIQWNYANLAKRKGRLERLKEAGSDRPWEDGAACQIARPDA